MLLSQIRDETIRWLNESEGQDCNADVLTLVEDARVRLTKACKLFYEEAE
jgi:hypothetical protein